MITLLAKEQILCELERGQVMVEAGRLVSGLS